MSFLVRRAETFDGSRVPAKVARLRKEIKYALVRHLGGPLEQVLFLYRLLAIRVKSLLGRPYTALYSMDRRLERYLDFRGGTFIEAGANDGIAQSNTYFLERKYGWRGVLVEPIPGYAAMCRRSRKANVVNCALGPASREGDELEILSGGLMSLVTTVDQQLLQGRSVQEHAAFGAKEFGSSAPRPIRTRVRALSNVLDELGLRQIDFFSLDVEGFELEVLKGLDFERHHPTFLLIETAQLQAVSQYLGTHYTLVESFSHHDYLFKSTAAE